MNSISCASFLALSSLLLGLFSACKDQGSNVDSFASGGSGGTGGRVDLNLGEGPPRDVAGAAGQTPSSGVKGCERFAGLDECGVTSVEATFSAANVLLVIDKSSSMDDQPEGFELKKWAALKAALGPALTAVADEMSFGLLLYPFGEQAEIPLDCFENCCQVPTGPAAVQVGVEPGSAGVSKVLAALDAAAPGGGTPTAAAL